MSQAFKMIKLDYYTVKSQIPGNFVALLAVASMFAFMGSTISTLLFTAVMYAALSANNIFILQEKNRLERLYTSLSLAGNNLVLGRYLFYYAHYIVAVLVASAVNVAVQFMAGNTLYMQDFIMAVCEALFVFTIITCVQIPVCMRLPYSQAQYWVIVIMLVMVLVVAVSVSKVFASWKLNTSGSWGLISVICVLGGMALFLVSYPVAKRCYRIRTK